MDPLFVCGCWGLGGRVVGRKNRDQFNGEVFTYGVINFTQIQEQIYLDKIHGYGSAADTVEKRKQWVRQTLIVRSQWSVE
jgi:hypothetical protein